jgi:hypothetical protein
VNINSICCGCSFLFFFEDSGGEAPTEILLKMKNEKVTT